MLTIFNYQIRGGQGWGKVRLKIIKKKTSLEMLEKNENHEIKLTIKKRYSSIFYQLQTMLMKR